MATRHTSRSISIVLVHGAFVDGSTWEGVHGILLRDGFRAVVAQIPTISLAGDVEATRRVIAAQNGSVVLVGHSYGGVVITEAGRDPRVAVLVYIAGYAPDKGESVAALLEESPPGAPVPPFLTPKEGYLLLDEIRFPSAFAADVSPEKAAFMAAAQVPFGLEALNGTVGEPAWRTKPSWYLVATADRMIPAAAQRSMSRRARATVVEASGSHSIHVSQPIVVAAFIEIAAADVKARSS